MKENKDCKVVQDLLPNYIEHLTSEETNQFIEEHLESCEECKAMLDGMKAELKIDTVQKDDREVEYIKKFNVKFKKAEYKFFVLIYTILAILVIGVTVFFGRKYFILNDLVKKSQIYKNVDNYYIEMMNYYGGEFFTREYWVKDGKGRSLTKYIGGSTQYVTKEDGFYWYTDDELTAFFEGENGSSVEFLKNLAEEIQNSYTELKAIFTYSIGTIKLNNKVCYKIKATDSAGSYIYFEKETGLPVKIESWEIGILAGETELRCGVVNYEYKFNCVKDKDLEFDDGKEKEKEEVTTEAKFTETAVVSDDNLRIEVRDINYDESNDVFSANIKFLTEDDKGVSTLVEYDYIIYDANENIIASSIPIGMNARKDKIATNFAIKHYNSASYATFVDHMIGVAEQRNNIMDPGIVLHTFTVPNLVKKLNLEKLTVIITDVRYKNSGENEEIEPYKDYIFTFNQT